MAKTDRREEAEHNIREAWRKTVDAKWLAIRGLPHSSHATGDLIRAARHLEEALNYFERWGGHPAPPHRCHECGEIVAEEETVWIDGEGQAAGPPAGNPHHVECAPAEPRPLPTPYSN